MPFISPAKLLVVLVVALIVLGPDKLPQVARQLGALWGDLRRFRSRLESDVRGAFPRLPPTAWSTRWPALRWPPDHRVSTATATATGPTPTGPTATGPGRRRSNR